MLRSASNPPAPSSATDWHSLRVHPNDGGHAIVAELALAPLHRALAQAAANPSAGEFRQAAPPKLPPPMIPGNEASPTSLCALQVGWGVGRSRLSQSCAVRGYDCSW